MHGVYPGNDGKPLGRNDLGAEFTLAITRVKMAMNR